MKFIVSSSALLGSLLSVNRVMASKNTLPILDNILLNLRDNTLTLTASDQESAMRATMPIEQVLEEGSVAIPARVLIDTLKEFPDQPLQFELNKERNLVDFTWKTGQFQVPAHSAEEYPVTVVEETLLHTVVVPAPVLLTGILSTLYATGEEELRPVMNGIFFDFRSTGTNLVASDSHKLVCYTRTDLQIANEASFILPKKPANILKNLLAKLEDNVTISFDEKNAFFAFGTFRLRCRLVEGNYPAYRSVIPQSTPIRVIADRLELLNAVRRVSVCSNQATNLMKIRFAENEIYISARDIDFQIAAQEKLPCQMEGGPIEMGFKSSFLAEILANISGQEVCIGMTDPTRVGLLSPLYTEDDPEYVRALIMPMMITA